MKITLSPCVPGFSQLVLGDDAAGDYIDAPDPEFVFQVDSVSSTVPGTTLIHYGRAKQEFSYSFTVSKMHADKATATHWKLTHPMTIATDAQLDISDGTTTSFHAFIKRVKPLQYGRSTLTTYEFIVEV